MSLKLKFYGKQKWNMIKVTILQMLRNVRFSENFACFFSCYPRLEIGSFVWLPAVCQIVFYIMYIRLFLTVRRILAWRFTSIINRKIFFFSSEHYIVAWSRQGMPKDLEKLHNLSCLFTVCFFMFACFQ